MDTGGFSINKIKAQESNMKPILEVADYLGISGTEVAQYGQHKTKITLKALDKLNQNKDGKLILVIAINPTPEK